MIGEPPTTVGAVQVIATTEALVMAALLDNKVGGSGLVMITAPLPDCDATELPTILVAKIVAWTLDPQTRL